MVVLVGHGETPVTTYNRDGGFMVLVVLSDLRAALCAVPLAVAALLDGRVVAGSVGQVREPDEDHFSDSFLLPVAGRDQRTDPCQAMQPLSTDSYARPA